MPQFEAANLVWTQAVINKGESFLYENGKWVDWSDYVAGLPFTFKHFDELESDDTTLSHFASASVDGTAIERDKDFTAVEGSVKVNLKPRSPRVS